jgi:hypothetical protein
MACDWLPGYVVGICLAEKIWKAVGGIAVRIEDTCLLPCCVPSIRVSKYIRDQSRDAV